MSPATAAGDPGPAGAPLPYRLIDHTADLGIEIRGADLEALYRNAALATLALVCRVEARRARRVETVTVSGIDWDDLMFNWLREVLYRWSGERRLLGAVRIRTLTAFRLSADLHLAAFRPARDTIEHDLKAVTYHRLAVRPDGAGWSATVIFDV